LSPNGPRRPLRYLMKWPIASQAKASPCCHAVSPEIGPLHSFCQIFFPILCASACERVIALDRCGQRAIVQLISNRTKREWPLNGQCCCFLDERHLSISVRVSAAINLTKPVAGTTTL